MRKLIIAIMAAAMSLPTTAQQHDWENQHVLQINREPARASFTPFLSKPGDMEMTLDGMWKFNWTKTPDEQPQEFYHMDFDDSAWKTFPVPGDWEVNGYGTPIYCSSGYTFKIDPPFVMGEPKKGYTTMTERNPTGCYRRTFALPNAWDGKEVYIHLGAVSSAFYLWINGQRVGYSQGSMEPAEFRITKYLKPGNNQIAMQVFKYSDASYLEDQDTWRLAGIHRSITLYATPKIRISDFGIRTILDDDYRDATLIIDPKLSVTDGQRAEGYSVKAQLFDADGKAVEDCLMTHDAAEILNLDHKAKIMNARYPQRGYAAWGWLQAKVNNPKKWTAEAPYLYTLRLSLAGPEGNIIEQIETKVGFRRLEIKDGRFLVNGKQVRFRGVNRQELDGHTGRVITTEDMQKDIMLLKRANVNAVRTGHYPNDPYWYGLCDKYGMYVMDEANLEEHGLRGTLASDPSWAAAFMDRVQRVVVRDRNHPCVVFWSLGNESGYGVNFAAASAWAKEYDPTRFIHYEGAQGANGNDPATVDITSRFYPRTMHEYHNPGVKDDNMERPENARWERLLSIAQADNGNRPVLTSEYAHAMGNAMGNFREYWDEIYSNPRMLGGFIWTWADEGLFKLTSSGKYMTAYGGDFGDKPNLKAFCLNGVVMTDRTLTPKYYEVKAVYSPIRITLDGNRVNIEKRDANAQTDNYKYIYTLLINGKATKTGELKDMTLPAFRYPAEADVRVNISAQLREGTLWAVAGHEITMAQFDINDRLGTAFRAKALKGGNADMEKAKAWIDNVRPHFYHAPTDNDKGFGNWLAKEWTVNRLDSLTTTTIKPLEAKRNDDGSVTVTVSYRYACTDGCIVTDYEYTMAANGAVDFKATYTPEGNLPTLPCIGSTFVLPENLQTLSWFGRGIHDSYPDRRESTTIGRWRSTVDKQYVHYPRPQYSGNHDDVAELTITDSKGKGWTITTENCKPFSFTALPYSVEQLCSATHDINLHPEENVYLDIDAAVMGIGNSSCGPGVLKKYTIPAKPHALHIRFSPLK